MKFGKQCGVGHVLVSVCAENPFLRKMPLEARGPAGHQLPQGGQTPSPNRLLTACFARPEQVKSLRESAAAEGWALGTAGLSGLLGEL